MKKGLVVISVYLLLISIVFSACGGSGKKQIDSTPVNEPTATVTPTMPKTGINPGDIAPDLEFPQIINGDELGATNLSDLRGKYVLLTFWASWCPHCREEMSLLDSLYQRYKNSDFLVITINIGEDKATVSNYVREEGLTLPVILDPYQETVKKYHITSIPKSFIMARDGTIIGVGAIDWDNSNLYQEIDRLISD